MNDIEKHKIYNKALHLWGNDAQMNMVIEECAELIQAINKFRRDPTATNMDNLCEEIADVEIMVEQAKCLIKKNGLIRTKKEFKLNRLSQRVEGSNQKTP
jgi:NTP pyrophosphatase (non-canonical NTP hydrolase)